MTVNINSPYLSKVFLDLILISDKFKTEFQALATPIFAEIESFRHNPTCICRGKIDSFVNNNRETAFNFLTHFLSNNKDIAEKLPDVIKLYITNTVSGKIFTIDNNEAAFADFSKRITEERFIFRNFTISEKGDKLLIYFL